MQTNRPKIAKELGSEATTSEVLEAGKKKWRELSKPQKARIEKKHAAANAKYQEDMEAFKAKGEVAPKATRSKAKERDPSKPKKPASSYILYLKDHREEIAKSLQPADVKSVKITEVAVEAAKRWKALPENTKQSYDQQAKELKEKYEVALQAYKR